MEWQPIETAPKDGTQILVAGNDLGDPRNGQHICVAEWCQDARTFEQLAREEGSDFSGWYDASDDGPLLFLTHWMPLPPPPQETPDE